MKSSKILAVVAMASLFAASSYAADAKEEVLATYGAITIKKVTYEEHENPYWDGSPMVTREKTVAYINDDLKAATTITEEIKVDSVYFNRVFKVDNNESRASTLMLPVEGGDASVSGKTGLDLFEFVKVVKECKTCQYEIHVKNNNAGHLKANTPYIALVNGQKGNNVSISLSTQNTSMKNFVLKPTAGNHVVRHTEGDYHWDFTGTYENIEFKNPKNIYGFAGGTSGNTELGEFVKAACKDGKCASIRPFRAYLKCVPKNLNKSADEVELPESVKVFVIDDNGNKGTTAIGTLNTRTGEFVKEDNHWFDMKGRVLDHKPTAKGTYYNNKKKVIIK